jgi:hypothetical protein
LVLLVDDSLGIFLVVEKTTIPNKFTIYIYIYTLYLIIKGKISAHFFGPSSPNYQIMESFFCPDSYGPCP